MKGCLKNNTQIMDIITNINNIHFICLFFLGILPSAISLRCYVCDGCPFRLNLTTDQYVIRNKCSKCLVSTELEDRSKSNRRCVTRKMEEYLKAIGINSGKGCSNVSQIPLVTQMKHLCFCSADLCNFSFNHSRNQMWIWFLEILYLLFQYG